MFMHFVMNKKDIYNNMRYSKKVIYIFIYIILKNKFRYNFCLTFSFNMQYTNFEIKKSNSSWNLLLEKIKKPYEYIKQFLKDFINPQSLILMQ